MFDPILLVFGFVGTVLLIVDFPAIDLIPCADAIPLDLDGVIGYSVKSINEFVVLVVGISAGILLNEVYWTTASSIDDPLAAIVVFGIDGVVVSIVNLAAIDGLVVSIPAAA